MLVRKNIRGQYNKAQNPPIEQKRHHRVTAASAHAAALRMGALALIRRVRAGRLQAGRSSETGWFRKGEPHAPVLNRKSVLQSYLSVDLP